MIKQYIYIILFLPFSINLMGQKNNSFGIIFNSNYFHNTNLINSTFNNLSNDSLSIDVSGAIGLRYSRRIFSSFFLETTYLRHRIESDYYVDKKVKSIPTLSHAFTQNYNDVHLQKFTYIISTNIITLGAFHHFPIKNQNGFFVRAAIGKDWVKKEHINNWTVDCEQTPIADCSDACIKSTDHQLRAYYLSPVGKQSFFSKFGLGFSKLDDDINFGVTVSYIQYHQHYLDEVRRVNFGLEISIHSQGMF